MYFSTWKRINWVSLPIVLGALSLELWLITGDSATAVVFFVIFLLIGIPVMLWSFSRMQDRLDDFGGAVPLSYVFDWDLEDDGDDADDPKPLFPNLPDLAPGWSPAAASVTADAGAAAVVPPGSSPFVACPKCGTVEPSAGTVYCRHCGATLDPARGSAVSRTAAASPQPPTAG